METKLPNMFAKIPEQFTEELLETLFANPTLKIERIVSKGHFTPESSWYDQAWDEWVLVLQGEAILLFEDDTRHHLNSGDYLFITAHQRHRVLWTTPDQPTVWLAIHINPA